MNINDALRKILNSAMMPRERQVFQCLGEWKHTREIAQEMSISIKTVETYISRLREAFECEDLLKVRRIAVEFYIAYPEEKRIYERQVFKTPAPDSKQALRHKLGIIQAHHRQ